MELFSLWGVAFCPLWRSPLTGRDLPLGMVNILTLMRPKRSQKCVASSVRGRYNPKPRTRSSSPILPFLSCSILPCYLGFGFPSVALVKAVQVSLQFVHRRQHAPNLRTKRPKFLASVDLIVEDICMQLDTNLVTRQICIA